MEESIKKCHPDRNEVKPRDPQNSPFRRFPNVILTPHNAGYGGYGLYVRDWLYVYDHCTAIWKVLTDAAAGELYNIGGGNEKTNIEVVETILQRLGKPKSLIKHVTDRPGHDRRYATDTTKIIKKLNWRPTVGFEEGLGKTIDWYLENKRWLANVVSGEYQRYYHSVYADR